MSHDVDFAGLAGMLPSLGNLNVKVDEDNEAVRHLTSVVLTAGGRPVTTRKAVRIYAATDEQPVDVAKVEIVAGIAIEQDDSGVDLMTEEDGTFAVDFTLLAEKPTEIVACTNCLYKVTAMTPPE